MDKVYIVETTHENGEKERREVEATHIIEAFQKGTYDCYATMVIVKEKVSRDYKAEIAYLTAENERLRGEVEEQKSIAEHEHAMQMEWFDVACDYKAENAELRARLEKAVELPVKMGDWIYCITDNRIIDGEVSEIHIEEFNTTITFVQYDFDGEYIGEWYVCLENYNNWFTTRAEAEARLKELKGEI